MERRLSLDEWAAVALHAFLTQSLADGDHTSRESLARSAFHVAVAMRQESEKRHELEREGR